MERWKDVVGWEGLYQVSDKGRVRSVDRQVATKHGSTRLCRGQVLRPQTNSRNGRLQVWLSNGPVRKNAYIHTLVLTAFVGAKPNGCEACHGPGGHTDNALSNLRWDTRSNNAHDKFEFGDGNNRRVKRSDGVEYNSVSEAARQNGLNHQNVHAVCKGKQRSAGGYTWEYLDG